MKNKIIYVFLIMLGLSSFIFLNVQAKAAPTTLKMKEKSDLYYFDKGTDYIHGYNFYQKELTDGTLAYCIGTTKTKVPAGMTLKLKSENTDLGLDYLIRNGYPNKSLTGNKRKDYYITQAAIWKYLDDTTGTTNWHNFVFDANSTGMELEVYKLVNGAKLASKETVSKKEVSITPIYLNNRMTLDASKTYFVSETIKVSAVNTSGKYTVNLTEAPEGTLIKNEKGDSQKEFEPTEGFIIYVPVNNLTETKGTVKIKLTAVGVSYKTYVYTPDKDGYQDIIPVEIYEEVSDLVDSKLELTYEKEVPPTPPEKIITKVKISKQDITTKKEVPGATLTIKDANDKLIEEWVSTSEPHYIENLTPGDYTLTEKIAPEGYVLSEETVKFTVLEDGEVVEVVMYNTPYTEVPITDLNVNQLVIIGAIILMALGAGLVIYYVKIQK